MTTPTPTSKGSNIRALIFQCGSYYVALSLDPVLDKWVSGMGVLTAADFGLLDFPTGQTDFTKHPNFSSGLMEFGLANEFGVNLNGQVGFNIDYDNLSLTLNQGITSKPSSFALPGTGLAGLGSSSAGG